jgi:galactose mutarotase-like enzyme
MNALVNSSAVRSEQGFEVYFLSNPEMEVAVVPELGAKIISLKNARTGREWMWHPPGGRKLFRNRSGDDFARSPLVGADECLPTVAPCAWGGRKLPDHGELWTADTQVDASAWRNGILKTTVSLGISPFEFERTLELSGNEIHLGYQLTNLSCEDEAYLWAMHPLIQLRPGDELKLPAATRALLNGADWVDAIDSAVPDGNCAKVFAAGVSDGIARIVNRNQGDWLEFEWDTAENNTLGIWLTRGGWHGHDHFALEPTNAADDALSVAATKGSGGIVPAAGSVGWRVSIRVGA